MICLMYDPQMSEDGKFVRRRRPLPLPRVRIHRTVYVKGFRPDSTLKEVAQWCMQYGDLLTIVMRRNEAGEFKGSIFVEYVTEQVARNMVEKKPTPPHAIPDEEHEPVMMKMTYLNMKTAKYEKDDKTTENVELQAKLSVPLVYGKVALLRLESVPEGSKNADMEGLITSSNIPMMDFDLLFVVPAMALDVEDQNKTDGVWYCVLKPKRDDAVIPWASSNLKLPKTNVLVRCYVVDDENEATTTLTAIKAYFKRSAGASRKRGIADDGQGGLGITGNQTGGDSHQHGGRGRGRGRGRGNFNKRRFRSD